VLFTMGKKLTELSGVNALGILREVETILRFEIEKLGFKQHEPKVSAEALVEAERAKTEIRDSVNPLRKSVVDLSTENSPYKYFPQLTYVFFETGSDFPKIEAKFIQFNEERKDGTALNAAEISHFKSLVKSITDTKASLTNDHFNALTKALTKWPLEKVFPALDILRFVVLNREGAVHYSESSNQVITHILSGASASPPATQMMIFRVIANLFHSVEGRKFCETIFHTVTKSLHGIGSSATNDHLQTAVSTVILNYAVYIHYANKGEFMNELLQLIKTLPTHQPEDSMLRILVAIGTIVYKHDSLKGAAKTAFKPFTSSSSSSSSASVVTAKISPIVSELEKLLG